MYFFLPPKSRYCYSHWIVRIIPGFEYGGSGSENTVLWRLSGSLYQLRDTTLSFFPYIHPTSPEMFSRSWRGRIVQTGTSTYRCSWRNQTSSEKCLFHVACAVQTGPDEYDSTYRSISVIIKSIYQSVKQDVLHNWIHKFILCCKNRV